jgi:cystathionine beta-lyase
MSQYKYDFETVTDRRSTFASKWDVAEGELPLSMADMEFQAAPEIKNALKERLDNGIFGYTDVPDQWYEAYVNWWKDRHGFEFEKEDLIFCTGVIPAISAAVRKLTTPAEKVLIQTPVYNIFYNSVLNSGRVLLENKLIYEDGVYRIDWEDFEEKLSDPQTSLMILCNPHNPIGKIWDKETLARIGELAFKHHVTVISDEIHCDITDPGKASVPFA